MNFVHPSRRRQFTVVGVALLVGISLCFLIFDTDSTPPDYSDANMIAPALLCADPLVLPMAADDLAVIKYQHPRTMSDALLRGVALNRRETTTEGGEVGIGRGWIVAYANNDAVSHEMRRTGRWEAHVITQVVHALNELQQRRNNHNPTTRGGDVEYIDIGMNIASFSVAVRHAGYPVIGFDAMRTNAQLASTAKCLNGWRTPVDATTTAPATNFGLIAVGGPGDAEQRYKALWQGTSDQFLIINTALGSPADAANVSSCNVFAAKESVGNGMIKCLPLESIDKGFLEHWHLQYTVPLHTIDSFVKRFEHRTRAEQESRSETMMQPGPSSSVSFPFPGKDYVVKMDVEFSEVAVLTGGSFFLTTVRPRAIFLEIWAQYAMELLAILLRHGYRCEANGHDVPNLEALQTTYKLPPHGPHEGVCVLRGYEFVYPKWTSGKQ